MSIRFHRGPKLLTIFHDPSSRVSSQVLSLLNARRAPPVLLPSDSSSGAPSSSQQHGQDSPAAAAPSSQKKSPAREYLDRASEHELEEPLFDLEVRSLPHERPTAEQWNLIGEYLHHKPQRRSELERLKDESGPFVVDWDGGVVERDEQGVKALLDRLQSEQASSGSSRGKGNGWGCVIA